jgi:phosphoglycolate phosphatase-like HAD superfamily hydrolase
MTILDTLTEAQRIIGQHWKEGQSPEQEQLLSCARDVLFFISSTGQPYSFEDYRKQFQARRPPRAANTEELVHRVEDFFERLLDEPQPAEEQELVLIILDALRFVSSTRQLDSFKRYLQHLESNDPPQVVASFDTREQAEHWLRNHPTPPHFASILIAGQYHTVAYDRETNGRYLPRSHTIEYYLASLKQDSPPATVASFDTLQEGEAWLSAQPVPPARAWVLISGAVYLAVSLPNVNHRALYPLSLADGFVIN